MGSQEAYADGKRVLREEHIRFGSMVCLIRLEANFTDPTS